MFDRSPDHNPLDLAGSLVTNGIATRYALSKPGGRFNPVIEADALWKDVRLWLGIAGIGFAQWQGGTAGRVSNDLAEGLLHSLTATETMNWTIEARQAEAAKQAAPAPAQIPQQVQGADPVLNQAQARARQHVSGTFG